MDKEILIEPLGNIFKTTSGGTPSRRKPEFYHGNIPWVKSGELENNIIYGTEEKITDDAIKNSSAKIFPAGTLLIALYGATIGKLAFLGIKATTNQAVCGIFDNGVILSKYTYYYLLFRRQKLIQSGMGGAQPNISQDIVRKQPFPIIPLPEQRAIVSKIEQLFSDLDNGIENFEKAQKQLKIYRQAVLKKAFEGELTGKWREEQTDLPSSKELLQQIKEEREKHYQKQLDEWKKAVKDWEDNGKEGKKLSRPKKPKELPPLSDAELKELPELPEKWCWIKVDKLLEHDQYSIKAGPFGSALKKQFYVKSGYKIYGQEQVISGNPYFGDYYIDNNKYNELISCAIKPQDILISLVGTVGKVLVLPDNIEHGIINPRLIKISLNESFYKTIFFKYYFESMFLKSLYKIHAHGATMEIINLGIIRDLPFPFCSTQEQNQIVREIETRLSVCNKLETTIAEALQKSETLRQSILKKSFEGKLLSKKELEEARNAPDWEPAEKLFERIKAEKKIIREEK